MSSRSNTKSKDRPRKKRDGTPDKSTTPSQDESSSPSRNVIWNEEIEKLQIKAEELPKLRPPRPPSKEKTVVRVSVQKKKKEENDKKEPKIQQTSANVSSQQLEFLGFPGLHYNAEGEVIPFSILGTYEDFHKEARRRGELTAGMPEPNRELEEAGPPSLKYEKKTRCRNPGNSETNALRNWYYRMMERKKQQGYISKLLQKSPEDLAMNQSENYRSIQEQRYLIDRTIPKLGYGKGYRLGSEFWYQQEQFGDDLTGLHTTLTQTQRGYPPPIEHVGLSQIAKEEKGCEWIGKRNSNLNYHWHSSEFLNKRLTQLELYIEEIDPWKPDFDALQVIGSNKPQGNSLYKEDGGKEKLDTDRDTFREETDMASSIASEVDKNNDGTQNESAIEIDKVLVFGPSLLFEGHLARWTGDSFSFKDEVAIETIVNFEAFTADRITSYLGLTNDGTAPVYYDWKKIAKENSFGLLPDVPQKFYFNATSDVIMPGDTMKLPFVFKSPIAGVFTEQWRFETRPVLCGGAAIIVTLRGVVLQRDKFKVQREQLEKELLEREAKQVVSFLLNELVSGIRTPEPPRSPIDAYITEEEIFLRNNPGLNYNHGLVALLKDIYKQLLDGDIQVENVWSLSIDDLQDSILELGDDVEDKKEMLLHQMNSIICKLTYIPHVPIGQDLSQFGYQILSDTIDIIVDQSLLLRKKMKLSKRKQESSDKEMASASQTSITQEHSEPSESKSGENEKGYKSTEGKGRTESGKDKPKGNSKEVRGIKQLQGKLDSKGRITPASTSKKTTSPVKSAASTPAPVMTPGDKIDALVGLGIYSPETSVMPNGTKQMSAEKLYKENFTLLVYNVLGDMADKMDTVFSSLRESTRCDKNMII